MHELTPLSVALKGRSSHCVFGRLDRTRLDNLTGGLGLEYRRLFGEGIDAFASLGRGLLDDHEFGKAGNEEGAGLLQLLITDGRKRLQDALDVALLQLRMLGKLADEFRLRHGF